MIKLLSTSLLLALAALAAQEAAAFMHPMHPMPYQERDFKQADVGETLYLTEYINRGDIATAKQLSQITELFEGVSSSEQPNGYSGFFTTNEATDHNMFFLFFEATDVDPSTAPVVIWLQGGPGSSSLFGAFELHGPITSVDANDADGVTGQANPYAWTKRANMLYIDNPVGAGYSYAGDSSTLPVSQDEAMDDLYETLRQFFTVFSEYQSNDFYAFGESYGGKWVPSIARRITEQNEAGAEIQINLRGFGIGDGFMSPPDSAIYGEMLYHEALVDEITRDELLAMEDQMRAACAAEDWRTAFDIWDIEFSVFLNAMGCGYYYDIRQCTTDPEENNYSPYVQSDASRLTMHVGDRPFGYQSGAVYSSMREDFMQSQRDDVEFLLDRYKALIYDGNVDIICNHPGILEMFNQMTTWSGISAYRNADRTIYRSDGETAGYVTRVDVSFPSVYLRHFVMRNAGHMVPRSQPQASLDMFTDFLNDQL